MGGIPLMGLSYQQAKSLGLGSLHPAATGKSDREILRDLGVEVDLPKRPAKYRNERTRYKGVMYDSKAEAANAAHLDENPLILWWIGQPRFRLGCAENVYVADTLVVPLVGDVFAQDVKGFWTPKFKRDVKLWRKYGPCPLWIISGGKLQQVIEGGRK